MDGLATTADGEANLIAGDELGFLAAYFATLKTIGWDGVGITREAFGRGEAEAFAFVERLAQSLGCTVATDAAGSLRAWIDGASDGAALVIGSHLDSVPQGGNFDGAAGIAAGLLVLARYRRQAIVPPVPLELIVLRCEESAWFDRAYVGSLALWGGLQQKDLERRHRTSRRTLGECLAELGADVDAITAGRRLRDPGSIRAFFEVHIEQGPVMVARHFPMAPVTGIRGNRRYPKNRIIGSPGHSGAVPRWLRHDTVFAFGELITGLDDHWKALLEQGIDLVVTAGVVQTNADEHGMTRIPGELTFSLEFRSQSEATLDSFATLVRAECEAIGQRRGVRFELDDPLNSSPATLDPWLQNLLTASAATLAVPTEPLPSGAGHDAAVFANAGVPAAMLFVRNENGSHNPDEQMELNDLLSAVDVLHHALSTTPWADPVPDPETAINGPDIACCVQGRLGMHKRSDMQSPARSSVTSRSLTLKETKK